MQVPVGDAVIGRVVNALGQPIDGKGEIKTDEYRDIEIKAPGIADRQPVNVPLQTGLKSIDSMVPIGRGQRELIIGDRGTGKTAIGIDTILNQKGQNVICIYVSIGQKNSNVVRVYEKLKQAGAMDYSIIVHAGASEGSRCSTSHHTLVYPSLNTSCIRAKTSSLFMMTSPNTQ